MIRAAKFADIHAIATFLLWCHSQSHYANSSVAVDLDETKRLIGSGISRHGHKNGGGCWLQVVDNDGAIDGLMYATLARVYSIGDKLMATDLFWAVNEHAAPGDAIILMRNMIAWAKSCPHVVEVHCATSAVIKQDPKVVSRLLKQMGMREYGYIHRLEFDRAAAAAKPKEEAPCPA